MNKFKVWGVVALIFVAGFAAGVGVTGVAARRLVARAAANPDRLRTMIERRMATRLRLDREQRARLDQILIRTQGEVQALRGQFAPPFHHIMSNAQTEISAILTPAQEVRFQQFREENRYLWQPASR